MFVSDTRAWHQLCLKSSPSVRCDVCDATFWVFTPETTHIRCNHAVQQTLALSHQTTSTPQTLQWCCTFILQVQALVSQSEVWQDFNCNSLILKCDDLIVIVTSFWFGIPFKNPNAYFVSDEGY